MALLPPASGRKATMNACLLAVHSAHAVFACSSNRRGAFLERPQARLRAQLVGRTSARMSAAPAQARDPAGGCANCSMHVQVQCVGPASGSPRATFRNPARAAAALQAPRLRIRLILPTWRPRRMQCRQPLWSQAALPPPPPLPTTPSHTTALVPRPPAHPTTAPVGPLRPAGAAAHPAARRRGRRRLSWRMRSRAGR